MKKILALALALIMVLAMGATAFAESESETHTISVKEGDTHTYDVYQLLTGELSADGKTLSNVQWGSSAKTPDADGKINGKTAGEFAKSLETLSGNELVNEVAKYFTEGTGAVGQVKDGTSKSGLAKGYYVMVDVTTPLEHTTGTGDDAVTHKDTKALNVITLVNDVEVTVKWGTTEDKKTITADTQGESGNTYANGTDNDNVSVGDTVTYQIEVSVPENADKFKPGTFFLVITDKLSTGLTLTADSIKVYKESVAEGNILTADSETAGYTVKNPGENGNTFEIGIVNAAQYAGKKLYVTYSAVVNENAVIGDAGNPNTSTVKFSTDPNKTYDGEPEDDEHPGFPDKDKNVPTGETPKSETKTYTTGIEIEKVDEEGNPLNKDVKFELSGTSVKKVVKKSTEFVEAENGEYYKLKDGTYTKTAPQTKDKMEPAGAGATAGYVVAEDGYTGEDAKVVDDVTYRPYVPDTDSDKTIYILIESNADEYDAEGKKYNRVVKEGVEVLDGTTDHKVETAVDSNGIARFDGLAEGTYTIKETQWPDGYNKAEDITLHVTYNENGEAKFSVTEGEARYEDGVIKITIVNHKGGTLPSTGGIGTTIFYAAGSILVLAAVVLLVTKRRMSVGE